MEIYTESLGCASTDEIPEHLFTVTSSYSEFSNMDPKWFLISGSSLGDQGDMGPRYFFFAPLLSPHFSRKLYNFEF